MKNSDDPWSDGAEQYNKAMTDFTRQFAVKMIEVSSNILPFTCEGANVLDNGCGSGSVTVACHAHAPRAPIFAADISPAMVDIVERNEIDNVRTGIADALNLAALGVPDGQDNQYSHVLSSFMIQFTPDPTHAVREMVRVLRPGGVLCLATWKKIDVMELAAQAGREVDSSIKSNTPYDSHWPMESDEATAIFENMGLERISATAIRNDLNMSMELVMDYFLSMKNPAAKRAMQDWVDSGRMGELEQAMRKIASQRGSSAVGAEALLICAQKPA